MPTHQLKPSETQLVKPGPMWAHCGFSKGSEANGGCVQLLLRIVDPFQHQIHVFIGACVVPSRPGPELRSAPGERSNGLCEHVCTYLSYQRHATICIRQMQNGRSQLHASKSPLASGDNLCRRSALCSGTRQSPSSSDAAKSFDWVKRIKGLHGRRHQVRSSQFHLTSVEAETNENSSWFADPKHEPRPTNLQSGAMWVSPLF